jgi:hypothetical protein
VAELGRKLKIPTPANDCAYAVLKLHRHGRRRALDYPGAGPVATGRDGSALHADHDPT